MYEHNNSTDAIMHSKFNLLLIEEHPRKSTLRVVPQKGVPNQISSGLEKRKYYLAWRFKQFEEHFLNHFIFCVICSDNFYFEIDQTCLQLSNKLVFAEFDR